MADHPLELLLARCEEALATVQVANGYRTDAGSVVTTEPASLSDQDAPAVSLCVYLDQVGRPSDPAQREHGWLTDLIVVGKRAHAIDQAQQGSIDLLVDIERAMATRVDFPRGGQAPRFQEAKFITRLEGLPWVGVVIRYSAHIARPRA